MDGRFVPNISFGPVVVEAVRRSTAKPLNVHLMIVEPERYIADFAKAGADQLLIQTEPSSTIHLHRVLSQIRELGKKAGAVLDPASPITFVEQVLHLCDIVMVMTVNPGFAGQAFLPEMLPKIRSCGSSARREISIRGLRSMEVRTRRRQDWPSRQAQMRSSPGPQYLAHMTTPRQSREYEPARCEMRI